MAVSNPESKMHVYLDGGPLDAGDAPARYTVHLGMREVTFDREELFRVATYLKSVAGRKVEG